MANCVKCGAEVSANSAFCGACGQRVTETQAGAVGPADGSVATAPAVAVSNAASSSPGLTMNMAAALSYALGAVTGVLFLVMEPYKNNRLVRFHAIQSIIFTVTWVVFWIVWSILSGILTSIAGYWVLTVEVPLDWLIGLGIFALWLYVMFQAYSEREYRLPFLGQIAAKQAH